MQATEAKHQAMEAKLQTMEAKCHAADAEAKLAVVVQQEAEMLRAGIEKLKISDHQTQQDVAKLLEEVAQHDEYKKETAKMVGSMEEELGALRQGVLCCAKLDLLDTRIRGVSIVYTCCMCVSETVLNG